LYEQREKRGMPYPPGLDLPEEIVVRGLTDRPLAS
jgi:hypothetical protein